MSTVLTILAAVLPERVGGVLAERFADCSRRTLISRIHALFRAPPDEVSEGAGNRDRPLPLRGSRSVSSLSSANPRRTVRAARHVTVTVGLALSGLLSPAYALEEDEQQPLYLEADNVVLDEQKAESVYTGNVYVQQGSMQIRADQVTVHHYEDRRPRRIIAVGKPATYRQEVEGERQPVEAEAVRMEYDTDKDEITLIDQAVIYQGKDTFRNDRIVYDRADAQVRAGTDVQGKERVKILIHPAER